MRAVTLRGKSLFRYIHRVVEAKGAVKGVRDSAQCIECAINYGELEKRGKLTSVDII